MSDHRGLQRALFRMQMDPFFAARVFARDGAALESLALAAQDLELLLELDPAAVDADPGDQRKLQLQGNLAGEYGLSVAAGPDDLLARFLASPEFHGALARSAHLAPAFGGYAARRAREERRPALAAMCALELAMVDLRRRRAAPLRARPGELRLSHRAQLVSLPAGTLDLASALSATRAGRGAVGEQTVELGAGQETVLLLAAEAPPHALPDVRPERLVPAVARLLAQAQDGLDAPARARLAAAFGALPAELDALAAELVAEGVLVAG